MVAVISKNKKKTLKKKGPAKTESKFISQALINRKKSKGKKKKRPKTKGLVYVKNLPHGFFEEQLRSYFSQFGAVTRIRLGRSPTTLNSRGYAFIEFRYPEVAEIAAQAMNNYIMFHRIVKTKFIPPEQIRHDYFRSSIMSIKKDGQRVMTSKKLLARQANVENTNKLMTDVDQKQRVDKVRTKVSKQKAKLAALGIDFDIDSVAKNMGEEVIAPRISQQAITIDDIADEELDGDNDETFDPSKFNIDSGDEFEDHDYDSDASASDEALNEVEKKTKAIEAAKTASKKYKETKENKNGTEKKSKVEKKAVKNKKPAQKIDESEKPAKKLKVSDEKPVVVTKPAKKSKVEAEEKPQVESKPKVTKKSKVEAEKPVVEEPKSARTLRGAKKVVEKPQVIAKPAKKQPKKAVEKVEEEPEIAPEPVKKQPKKVVEKVPAVEKKAAKSKQVSQKEPKLPVEKKLAEKKIVKKAQNKLEGGTEKKVTKVPQAKVKAPLTKAKESPKTKKVTKVNKKAAVK
ncbi:axoneme-associated protein mst101(2) [Chironomus tepperi]|uniref:axoneme-associated protein mst101(2) n=1 Tax=Chironomus tepperi TaxID=113505 RepID=UPI00391F3211